MTFFCETPDGEQMHLNAYCEAAAAEAFVEELARSGMYSTGDTILVRVIDGRCTSPKHSYFEVDFEMLPDATAKPCAGAGRFDDLPPY